MKKALTILLSFILIGATDSAIIVGIYEVDCKIYFSTIELKKDKTFVYKQRGDSCWTWSDREGVWGVENNILVLKDTYLWYEETPVLEESIDNSICDEIRITFNDKKNRPIDGMEVEYRCGLGREFTQKIITNDRGLAVFVPITIKGDASKEESLLCFSYEENGGDAHVSHSLKLLNNRITVTIDHNPIHRKKERIEKYKVEDQVLIAFEGNLFDAGMKFQKKCE